MPVTRVSVLTHRKGSVPAPTWLLRERAQSEIKNNGLDCRDIGEVKVTALREMQQTVYWAQTLFTTSLHEPGCRGRRS